MESFVRETDRLADREGEASIAVTAAESFVSTSDRMAEDIQQPFTITDVIVGQYQDPAKIKDTARQVFRFSQKHAIPIPESQEISDLLGFDLEKNIKEHSKFVSKLTEMRGLRPVNLKPALGFMEGLKDTDVREKLPLVGGFYEAINLDEIERAFRRLENNDYQRTMKESLPKATTGMNIPVYLRDWQDATEEEKAENRKKDLELVAKWYAHQIELEERGTSTGYKVAQGLTSLPGFMIDFALTGGSSKAVSFAARQTLKKIIGKHIATSVGNYATRLTGTMAGAAARTALMPHRIAPGAQQGDLVGAILDTYIENLSEMAGPAIGSGMSKTAGYVSKFGHKISPEAMAKVDRGFKAVYAKMHPEKGYAKMIKEGGFDGFLEELGEERLGAILRYATGLEESPFPTAEQLATEAIVIAAPTALGLGVNMTASQGQKKIKIPYLTKKFMELKVSQDQKLKTESGIAVLGAKNIVLAQRAIAKDESLSEAVSGARNYNSSLKKYSDKEIENNLRLMANLMPEQMANVKAQIEQEQQNEADYFKEQEEEAQRDAEQIKQREGTLKPAESTTEEKTSQTATGEQIEGETAAKPPKTPVLDNTVTGKAEITSESVSGTHEVEIIGKYDNGEYRIKLPDGREETINPRDFKEFRLIEEQQTTPEEIQQQQRTALDAVNQAEKDKIIDKPTAKIWRMLINLKPTFSRDVQLSFSKAVRYATEAEMTREGVSATNEQGMPLRYRIYGETVPMRVNNNLRFAMNLYGGTDATTAVHEYLHYGFEYLTPQERAAFIEYLRTEKPEIDISNNRAVNEAFAGIGTDYFFARGYHKPIGTLDKIFARFKQTMNDLIDRISRIGGANINQEIENIYKRQFEQQRIIETQQTAEAKRAADIKVYAEAGYEDMNYNQLKYHQRKLNNAIKNLNAASELADTVQKVKTLIKQKQQIHNNILAINSEIQKNEAYSESLKQLKRLAAGITLNPEKPYIINPKDWGEVSDAIDGIPYLEKCFKKGPNPNEKPVGFEGYFSIDEWAESNFTRDKVDETYTDIYGTSKISGRENESDASLFADAIRTAWELKQGGKGINTTAVDIALKSGHPAANDLQWLLHERDLTAQGYNEKDIAKEQEKFYNDYYGTETKETDRAGDEGEYRQDTGDQEAISEQAANQNNEELDRFLENPPKIPSKSELTPDKQAGTRFDNDQPIYNINGRLWSIDPETNTVVEESAYFQMKKESATMPDMATDRAARTSPPSEQPKREAAKAPEIGYKAIKGKDSIGRDIPDWSEATVYHATNESGLKDITEKGYRILGEEAEDGQGGYYGEAVSFTPTKSYAQQFGQNLTIAKLDKNIKILNLNDPADWETYRKITKGGNDLSKLREQLTRAGYDGVYDAGAGDLFLYNPEKAKLQSSFNPTAPQSRGATVKENLTVQSENTPVDSIAGTTGAESTTAPVSKDTTRDIKGQQTFFQLREENDEKNLITIHNISARKLIHADKMGGLAMPSVSISRTEHPMQGFGEITLIAKPDLVNPKMDRSAKVFAADAYSPRYPQITYKFKGQDVKKYTDYLNKGNADPRTEVKFWNLESHIERDGIHGLWNDESVIAAYLREIGKPVDTQTIKDDWDMKVALRQARDETQRDFDQWLEDLPDKIGSPLEEKIFNGFTYAGNRRYLPHNLDVVMRLMKQELRDGEGFNYGVGSIRAKITPQFRTVKQIQGSRDKIISHDDFEKLKEEIDNEFTDLANYFQDKLKYKMNTFGYLDAFSEHLKEAIDTKNIKRTFGEYYNEISEKDIVKIAGFLEKLRNMPTEYFEAKLQRRVSLNEFSGAVIPENAPQKIIETLQSHGITEIKTYKENDEESRKEAINTFKNAMFQMRPVIQKESLYDYIQRRKAEIERDKKATEKRAGQNLANILKRPAKGGELQKESSLVANTRQRAIENGISDDFGELPGYTTRKGWMQDQAQRADQLVQSDPEKAKRIAMRLENPPGDLMAGSVYKALELKAISEKDAQTIYDLAKSPLARELSIMGQAIKSVDRGTDVSPVKAIQRVQEVMEKQAAMRNGNIDKARIKTEKEIRQTVKKTASKRPTWEQFIKSIECN